MAITKIQEAQGISGGTSANVTITTPSAGNSLIAIVNINDSGGSPNITGISGGGVTWSASDSILYHSLFSDTKLQIWYGHNSSGSGTTVTVSVTGSVGHLTQVIVSEWSGLGNAAPESTNHNSGNSTTPTTNSATPSSAVSLVIGGFGFATSSTTYSSGPTNSFTRMTPSTDAFNNWTVEGAYQIESSSSSYSTGLTLTGFGDYWGGVIAAFGGVSSAIKTVNGLAKASVKTIDGLAIAGVKTINGLA